MATVPVAFSRTVPLLWAKLPLVNAPLDCSSRTPEVDVMAVPDKVNMPPMMMFAEPPVKVPPLNVAAPVTVMEFVPCEIAPV
jgi:hypothetical protein